MLKQSYFRFRTHLSKQTLMWPVSKRKTKNKVQYFVIRFLIWNKKTNFKKYISFFKFDYWLGKRKTKKYFFGIYFDLKPISKNKNQNFQIHFLISNQKMNFKQFFRFSILIMKLKNEKWKILKIRFVLKSKNELYFRYTYLFLMPLFVFHFHKKWKTKYSLFFVFRFYEEIERQIT